MSLITDMELLWCKLTHEHDHVGNLESVELNEQKDFWLSTHRIECSRCGNVHYRTFPWPEKNMWSMLDDSERPFGYTEGQVRLYASKISTRKDFQNLKKYIDKGFI